MYRMTAAPLGSALAAAALALCGGGGAWAAGQPTPTVVYEGCAAPRAVEGRRVTIETPDRLVQAIRTARAGDVIVLGDGDFGKVNITGDPGGFVTVTAAAGARPRIQSLQIGGGHTPTGHWIIRDLTLSGPGDGGVDSHGWPTHSRKLSVSGAADVIIQDNRIESVPGDYPWRPDVPGVPSEVPLAEGLVVDNSTCVAVLRNHIRNVFDAIKLDGDQIDRRGTAYLIQDNVIDQFGGDGIDNSGSHVLIKHNMITNAHDTCRDLCIHNDGIQGWTHWDDPKITESDVTIDGNTILLNTVADLPMAADEFQGITIFDGHWDRITVVNNVIVINAWHGITLFGVTHGLIANNSVVGVNPARKAWISAAPAKGTYGRVNSDQVVIRNNITPAVNIDRRGQGPSTITVDHNLTDADPRRVFMKVDPAAGRFDLRLKPGSPAQGKGTADSAPATDIEGRPRRGSIDLGAYAGGG